MFAALTHLDLLDIIAGEAHFWPSFLALLPVLTHLSMYQGLAVAESVLASCNKIEVLISLQPDAGSPVKEVVIDDERFVYMVVKQWEYEKDWVAGVRRGVDFWARADAFVTKKRRVEIEPSLFPSSPPLFTLMSSFAGSRCWIEERDGIGPAYFM
ncbi:hypothetical protein B0H19DRAFT_1233438 [Mycena capillaripes]|nr:hypothetical protein B0H19DRAFT_1233438 [Mycena capillaripes]